MGRYAEWNEFIGNLKTDTWGVTTVSEVGIAFDKATADVVPKSEVEKIMEETFKRVRENFVITPLCKSALSVSALKTSLRYDRRCNLVAVLFGISLNDRPYLGDKFLLNHFVSWCI